MKKNRHIGRWLILLLIVLVLLAAVTAGIVMLILYIRDSSAPPDTVPEAVSVYSNTTDAEPITVDAGHTLALYFKALAPFSAIDLRCAANSSSGSSFELKLYSFIGDYATSTAANPLESVRFPGSVEQAWTAACFRSLKAGEYLLVISSKSAMSVPASYTQSELTANKCVVYMNGEMLLNSVPYINIIFDEKSEAGQYIG